MSLRRADILRDTGSDYGVWKKSALSKFPFVVENK